MNRPVSSPCSGDFSSPFAPAGRSGRTSLWRRLRVAMLALSGGAAGPPLVHELISELDPRTLSDIGCDDVARRRVEKLTAPAHRMPEFW